LSNSDLNSSLIKDDPDSSDEEVKTPNPKPTEENAFLQKKSSNLGKLSRLQHMSREQKLAFLKYQVNPIKEVQGEYGTEEWENQACKEIEDANLNAA